MDEVIVAETCESDGEPIEKADFHGLNQISSSEGSSLEADMESVTDSIKPLSSFDFMEDLKKMHSNSQDDDVKFSYPKNDSTKISEAEKEKDVESEEETNREDEKETYRDEDGDKHSDAENQKIEKEENEDKQKKEKEENEDSVRSDVSFVPPSYDEIEEREQMRINREKEREELIKKMSEKDSQKLETKITQESPKTQITAFSPAVTSPLGSDINNLIYLQNYNTPNKSSSSSSPLINNSFKSKELPTKPTTNNNNNTNNNNSQNSNKSPLENLNTDENPADVKYFENSNKFIFEIDNSRIVIGKAPVFHEPYFSQDEGEDEEKPFPASDFPTSSNTTSTSSGNNKNINNNEDFSLTFEPTPPSSPENEKSKISKKPINSKIQKKIVFGSNDETADSGVQTTSSTTTTNSTHPTNISSSTSSHPPPPTPLSSSATPNSKNNNNSNNINDDNNDENQHTTTTTKTNTTNNNNIKNDPNFNSIHESEGSQFSQQPFFFIKPKLSPHEDDDKELPEKEREPIPKRRRLTKRESDDSGSGNDASSDEAFSERRKKIKNEKSSISKNSKSTSPGKTFNSKSPEKEQQKSPSKVAIKNENTKNNKPKPIFNKHMIDDMPVTPPKKGKSIATNGNSWTKVKKKRVVDSDDDDFQADPFTCPSPVPSSPCIAIPLHSNSPLSKTGKNFQLKKKVKDEGVTVYDLDSPVSQIYTKSNNIFFEGVTFIFTGLSKGPHYEALVKMINSHGGKIGDFPSPPTPTATLRTTPFAIIPSKFLVADKERRTLKYLLALATGTPCIQPTWVRHCCEQGCILPYVPYLLPAGYSLSREEVLYVTLPKNNILQGFRVKVVGPDEFVSHWETVVIATGANVLKTLSNDPKGNTVIISDPFPTQEVKKSASSLKVPIVSVEWVIQCLINQISLPFDGHPRYHYRYLRDHYSATGASISSLK